MSWYLLRINSRTLLGKVLSESNQYEWFCVLTIEAMTGFNSHDLRREFNRTSKDIGIGARPDCFH
jgi:hypothetical protein